MVNLFVSFQLITSSGNVMDSTIFEGRRAPKDEKALAELAKEICDWKGVKACTILNFQEVPNVSQILAVQDKWHPHINGKITPEVRSNDPHFPTILDFLHWVAQHGGTINDIYYILSDED